MPFLLRATPRQDPAGRSLRSEVNLTVTGHSRDTPDQTPDATEHRHVVAHILHQGNMCAMDEERLARVTLLLDEAVSMTSSQRSPRKRSPRPGRDTNNAIQRAPNSATTTPTGGRSNCGCRTSGRRTRADDEQGFFAWLTSQIQMTSWRSSASASWSSTSSGSIAHGLSGSRHKQHAPTASDAHWVISTSGMRAKEFSSESSKRLAFARTRPKGNA